MYTMTLAERNTGSGVIKMVKGCSDTSDHLLILNASLTDKDDTLRLAHSTVCKIELCACVSFLSHLAQIKIIHNISISVMYPNAKLLFIM